MESDTLAMTLHQIGEEAERIDAILESTAGDETLMTREQREELQAFVSTLRAEAAMKADGYAAVIRGKLAMAEARRQEAAFIADSAKKLEESAERLKRFVCRVLSQLGTEEIAGARWKLSRQRNPPSCDVFAPDLLPHTYHIEVPATTRVDKAAVLRDLKAGIELPGAQLNPPSEHLRIR